MRDAVMFNPNNQLEFQEVRMNVARIPEVMARVRDAETAWSLAVGDAAGDLASFLTCEDERFCMAARRKLVVCGVVQLGLFDRYVRAHGLPAALAGAEVGPASVALGRRTLDQFVADTARATRIASVRPAWWMREGDAWVGFEAPWAFDRLVIVGPGGAPADSVESIGLDPALAWFWTSLTASGLAIAN